MKRIVIAMLLCVGVVGAQQGGSLVWNPNSSNVTVNAPPNAGTLTYQLPPRSGTLALTSDITVPSPTPTPTPITIANGTITLSNGSGTAQVPSSVARCVVSDPSGNSVKYAKSGTTLTVQGVGPSVDYLCL